MTDISAEKARREAHEVLERLYLVGGSRSYKDALAAIDSACAAAREEGELKGRDETALEWYLELKEVFDQPTIANDIRNRHPFSRGRIAVRREDGK